MSLLIAFWLGGMVSYLAQTLIAILGLKELHIDYLRLAVHTLFWPVMLVYILSTREKQLENARVLLKRPWE